MWGLIEYENDELIKCVRVLRKKIFHAYRFWGLQSSLCFNVKHGQFEDSRFIVLVCRIYNF